MKDYKKILEGVVDIISTTEKSDIGFANICTYIGENCPELAESEDEKIRKVLIDRFKSLKPNFSWYEVPIDSILAWLEKQGEQIALNEPQIATVFQKVGLAKIARELGNDSLSNALQDVMIELGKQCKQKPKEEYDIPNTSIRDSEEVTSRMKYIDKNLKPIAEFVMGYANWDLRKDEWNHPVATVPLFRVLDALVQKGKQYSEEHSVVDNNIEPKFKVGDWVVKNDDSSVCVDYSICKITKVENGNYTIESIYGYKGYVTFKTFEKDYHIFTIEEDAKDGDVLAIGYEYFLFKEKKDTSLLDPPVYTSHCFVNSSGAFRVTNGRECGEFHSIENEISACPATKEQRDFLFQQMKKSGYEWDADKKELKIIDCNNIKYEPNGPSVIEEKPIEKKTKFKVGDWVTNGEYNWKITAINSLYYTLQSQDGDMSVEDTIANVKKYLHYWTIQDAKDGDVLVDVIDKRPFIFKGLLDSTHPNCPVAYCGIDLGHNFMIAYSDSWWTYKKVIPATKEQRDFLFQQMKEAGYEWDANEKKLIKI